MIGCWPMTVVWLGGNPNPDPNSDNRQRQDYHQHVDRQPCGYASRTLSHSACPLRPTLCTGWPQVAVNRFTGLRGSGRQDAFDRDGA